MSMCVMQRAKGLPQIAAAGGAAAGGATAQLTGLALSFISTLAVLRKHGRGSYCAKESAQRNQPSTVQKLLRLSAAP